MTDFRRMILLGILFLIGMMLWNAWIAEHAPTAPQASQITATPATSTPTSSNSSEIQSSSINNNNITNRYISIKTNVLDATVDRVGGNLVNVKLLKYPVAVNQPNNPVTLLNNDPDNYYIATNGISGQNIPDQIVFNAQQEGNNIILSWQNNQGIKITKTYNFSQDDYLISVKQTIQNNSSADWQGKTYSALERKPVNTSGMGPFNLNTYTGAVISSPDKRYEKVSFKNMSEDNIDRTVQNGWVAMVQHYFLSAWIPNSTQNYHYFSKVQADNDIYTIGMQSPQLQVEPNQSVTNTDKLYVGPEIADKLEKIAPGLNLTVDYGILWFIANIIFIVMKKLYAITGNWGWAIILVTLLIKIIFYKLNSISFRSMAKMRNLQPKLEQIRERCGDDRQKLAQATMELYKKEKVNPMGGCLPLIVQIPVFLSLYWVIMESVELRQAPFILWIHDLSLKDPYYILPIIMGLTIFIQQWLSPKAADPVQQKVMMLMPVIFTALFLSFPAGLVLYWVANNTLSILQQYYIMNHVVPKDDKK